MRPILTSLLILLFCTAAAAQESSVFEELTTIYERKHPPGSFDWLAQHRESGQTFSEFLAANFPAPDEQRPYIYISLLGDFSEQQDEVLGKVRRYIEAYFQTPVRMGLSIPLADIPDSARRIHPVTGERQILSVFVIEEILKPRMPSDAFAFVAFTTSDLWPGEGWNFVFGQASMEDRVGVWSLARNGDPDQDEQQYLKRAIQTGTHEVGHMFGLDHCIYFECNMNGSNSLRESDRRPLGDCPVCFRKLSARPGFDLRKRFAELAALCDEFGFVAEAEFFRQNLRRLNAAGDGISPAP